VKRYLYFYFVVGGLLLSACNLARVIPIKKADEPPVLSLATDWKSPPFPTADNRLQVFFYRNIRYPALARDLGITANFRASYRITKSGEVKNVDVVPKVFPLTSDTIIIVTYRVPLIEKSHGKYGAPPIYDFTYADTLAGRKALYQEVERMIDLLPDFEPARRNGRPVTTRMSTVFIFRLEQ